MSRKPRMLVAIGHLDLPPVGPMIADKSRERVDRAMIFAWLPVFSVA